MNKQKKLPIRKCVATLEQYPKREMFRIVRTPEGKIEIDDTGKMRGRGAYLVKKASAINMAKKKQVLNKHLETQVPDEIYERLLSLLGDTSS